ncbi:mannose-6-phosphate isomerase [Kineosphaera limosa]|uniref:mannose-6-phosphate isomerase n=1 Tax=Kineosphaera limosa NBRC 100340 TaxID=1184609 RepID=K6X117_9MICO|nr:mannose-6-phosphate isomerase, class I [Kineosphaera limosa]NYE00144.1 mannose-6-phosphate isomerase [Kineosphaera limosa]GAB98067.1 mannose-6-phosphate isomerase [Kineosphaera limosa NBRC 100340]
MHLLEPVVKPYDWGSRHIIAELLGAPAPSPGPQAELWMGAHPAGPSIVRNGSAARGLDEIVAADPGATLGDDVADRFEGRLPFLLKVLAADKALSIQVHPDRETARSGFRAQGGDAGTYVDDWPKPEVLCALTEFEALAGLREPGAAAALLRDLGVPALDPVVARLERGDDAGLVEALRMVLAVAPEQRESLLAQVVAACRERAWGEGDHAAAYDAVVRIAVDHPGDLGAVASLLLNHTVLQPGEAIFLAAGGLHAYLRGAGIEILANSDNVLRAGLTSKPIDIDELCRVVDPGVGVPVLRPSADAHGVIAYDTDVPEFSLHRIERSRGALPLPGFGPRIVFVADGVARLDRPARDGGQARDLTITRGGSAFVSAADGAVTCTIASDSALVYVAAPGALR